MKKVIDFINSKSKEYRSIPFWSWNDDLEPDELVRQIEWMNEQGFGGYFMHARSGLITEYLGDKWFECVKACLDAGDRLGMESWAYDENGWPSGFVGGELLKDKENCDKFLTISRGKYDKDALASYDDSGDKLVVARADDGKEYLNVDANYSPSTADILNPEVVNKFLTLTHERYKSELGKDFNKKLKGFFTDEPQYQRWNVPYTEQIRKYFKEQYGEDIADKIGLLFVEKDGYKEFRYKYWKGMQTLMLSSFAKQLYGWCDKNGVELTGHYVEEPTLMTQMMCNAGIMPFYQYEHIPGMDWLGRDIGTPVAPKQVSSVARQCGKKKVLTETYGLVGWDVTPTELKRIAEWQYVNGVNLMCQHLLPYSERGQRKRDYPAHFSWANPWVRQDFKGFNDYFASLGALLGESDEIVSVAVFSPIRSLYFDYKREQVWNYTPEVDRSYQDLCAKLSRLNIPYHIVDETVMAERGSVKDGKLIVGKCSYDFVVFPKTYTMDKVTETLLLEYYNQGGKILFTDGKIEYLEWEKHDYAFDSNVTLDQIAKAQEYAIDDKDTDIQSTLRVIDGKKFIYAVNLSLEKEYTVTFSGDFNGFTVLDLESGKTYPKSNELTFGKGQSYVLFYSDEERAFSPRKQTFNLTAPYTVKACTDNYLTLDCLKLSFDGENYLESCYVLGAYEYLLKQRYKGDLWLKYTFKAKTVPQKISLLAEDMNTVECLVNGKKVTFNGSSDFEKALYKADISFAVKEGDNEIVFKIKYYQRDYVYYALFGENVTEGLKNCLTYDTAIESVYLVGEFGVFSERGFRAGKEKNVWLSDEFYLDVAKQTVTDTVKEGYPFFAGNVTFEKKFNYEKGAPTVLKLDGRFALCKLKINGVSVEKSYFTDSVDLADYLKEGENTAEITLYSGNRNLLGPHHLRLKEEETMVNFYAFDMGGSWEGFESPDYRQEYAFVKFGLYE